ncbi:methylenetetrahydrofolate reductase [Haloechinothrix salitolerans]|uniref:Methylenetetrahydrofolate reductase n=1 Tax=Haloechinothrix salitolerans TaxID=926830 RepID=A0ABW2BVL6_9PSEU
MSGSVLETAVRSGRFAVTAEVGPPRGPDPGGLCASVRTLRGWVDAVNITDNQSGVVRLSSMAGSVLALAQGVEPVMQISARDRNRIAIQSDLLAAAALGIPNVLLLTGDHPKFGDHPEAKPVFDVDSVQMLWIAKTMRDHQRLLSGKRLDSQPRLFLGGVENPASPPTGFRARRLGKKVAAGAQFVQTQFVFDIARFERWMDDVRNLGLHERVAVLAGVGPIGNPRALRHMRTKVPGLSIPDSVVDRLSRVDESRFAEEGIRLCVETIERIRETPGVSGVHLMAFGREHVIPEIIERAGIQPPRSENEGSGLRQRSGHVG